MLESRFLAEISTTSDMHVNTALMVEKEKELNSLLMRMKEKSAIAGRKLEATKTQITTSGPITSWQIEWEKWKAVIHFTFLESKIAPNGGYNHQIRKQIFIGRRAMRNLGMCEKAKTPLSQQMIV